MAFFECTSGGGTGGVGGTLTVTADSSYSGLSVICTDGTTTFTKTFPSTSPYQVVFNIPNSGTWTVTSDGHSVSAVVNIDYETSMGFSWRAWVNTAQYLDSSDYADLDELLADELALRELCLEHNCVDYLCSFSTVNADLETVINNDIFAKWVNLSNYALDSMYANAAIKTVMDTADKYGYGEWALVEQVPKMTSNTAPYGEAFANGTLGSGYDAYKAFDGANDSTGWAVNGDGSNVGYIGYHFPTPQRISKVYMANRNEATPRAIKKFKIQGSNTGNTNDYHDISVELTNPSSSQAVSNTYDISVTSTEAYSYIRLFITDVYDTSYYGIGELQFYAWQPKGNVPVMTSNSAPYGEVSASAVNQNYAVWKAFNGTNSNYLDCWYATRPTFPAYIRYKSTNPTCVRKVTIKNRNGGSYGAMSPKTFQVQGSNDGSTWNTIATLTNNNDNVGAEYSYSFDNSNYYLYHQLSISEGNDSSGDIAIGYLQFYGRELSVSVPVMATNTTPYGEAFATSEESSSHKAYMAFDNNNSTNWSKSSSVSPCYLGYDFKKPVVLKMVMIRTASTVSSNERIIAYGDDKIDTEFIVPSVANADNYTAIDNNIASDKWMIKITGSGSWNTTSLQFFGKDYSEKEFEQGSTKKWLYDHGVELEAITAKTIGSGVARKDPDCLHIEVPNSTNQQATFLATLDLTPYDLSRMKLRNGYVSTSGGAQCFAPAIFNTTTPDVTTSMVGSLRVGVADGNFENNFGLDISSFDASYTMGIYMSNGSSGAAVRKQDCVEWWLE